MLWNALEDPRNTWKHFQDCNREEFRGRETFERSFRKEQRTVREWPVSVGAAAYSRLHKGEPPLLAVDVCSRVATKKARRNRRASRKEEKKFGPAIVPVLKCPYAPLYEYDYDDTRSVGRFVPPRRSVLPHNGVGFACLPRKIDRS